MDFARAIEWQQASARAEALLSREQRAKIARARAERLLALTKFDPDQPRDEGGKWSSGGGDGGGSTAFVSPSVSAQTFTQAVQSLGSKEQARLKQFSEFVDGKLGIQSENRPAIGAWADGAENSMMIVARGATTEQMRAACAMKGYLADQKSVLMFDPSPTGTSFMASFDVAGKPEDLHNKLLADGLAFHTLEPRGGDAIRVHVYGSDQDTINAIDKASGNSRVHFVKGSGEFLGTSKDTGSDRDQRDDARRVYEQTIKALADSGPVGGRDVGKIWGEARDYWQSISSKALRAWRAKIARAKAERVLKYDPNQPRDELGRFGETGGAGVTPTSEAPSKPTPEAPEKPVKSTYGLMRNMSGGKFDGAKTEAQAKSGIEAGVKQALADGVKPLQGSQGHPGLIATARIDAGPNAGKDVYTQPTVERMQIKEGRMRAAPFQRNMEAFRDKDTYPNFRPEDTNGSPEEIRQAVVKQMESNIRLMASDQVQREAETIPADTKIWYPGARTVVDNKLDEYREPMTVNGKEIVFKDTSVAAAYAAISPQKDWYENVYLGNTIIDTYRTQQNHRWDDKMNTAADEIFSDPPKPKDTPEKAAKRAASDARLKAIRADIDGKTLGELTDPDRKAAWIRAYNEGHSNRRYREINPDGSEGDWARSPKSKEITNARWGPFNLAGNAIRALESNGDTKVISDALGDRHKVRSFYNNILDPFSKNDDSTQDTHAVGVALLRPLGGSHLAVLQSLGTGKGVSSSDVTGSKGLYGLYAEATRNVAKEFGIQTRELQSITWETKRKIFAGVTDTPTAKRAIDKIWKQYQSGDITLEKAQQDVLARAREARG